MATTFWTLLGQDKEETSYLIANPQTPTIAFLISTAKNFCGYGPRISDPCVLLRECVH